MAEFSEELVLDTIHKIKEAFADGFQFSDIACLVQLAAEFSELFQLDGEEKKELALRVAGKVIDETDTPWLPDPLFEDRQVGFPS